jgi:AcrR family transcriptional regulator
MTITDTRETTIETTPNRGRPRSHEAKEAILLSFVEAVREQGYAKVSIDAVAKSAGVSRSTIYRWYDDKAAIALDAAKQVAIEKFEHKLKGDFEVDLRRFLTSTFATANDLGQLFTALMAEAQANKKFAKLVWDEFSSIRRQTVSEIITPKQQKQKSNDISTEFILDMIFGSIWYRLMSGHAPLNKVFLNELIAATKLLIK